MDAAGLYQSRAQRFDVAVPTKLCSKGDGEWRPVLAENVSGSGALLLESQELPVGAELDVWLQMHELRPFIADIVCPSIVVRCEERQPAGLFRVGVKFKGYEFRRSPGDRAT
jgi:hypothetical protein